MNRCDSPSCDGHEVRYGPTRCEADCRTKDGASEECAVTGDETEVTPDPPENLTESLNTCCGGLISSFFTNGTQPCCAAQQDLFSEFPQDFDLDSEDDNQTYVLYEVDAPR